MKIIRGNKLEQGIIFAGIIWGKIEYSLENLGEVRIYTAESEYSRR